VPVDYEYIFESQPLEPLYDLPYALLLVERGYENADV